jgi:hypothetical protein
MRKIAVLQGFIFFVSFTHAQSHSNIYAKYFFGDVIVTIDEPLPHPNKKPLLIILYALPNGNSTEQTMGKKTTASDDWHFDIQHIKAQTEFIRRSLKKQEIIVCYLENKYKSWPLWKQKHPAYRQEISLLVDSVYKTFHGSKKTIELCSHSGGGSFIFGYLDGVNEIPSYLKRISFIDSNYGYDSSYSPVFKRWLENIKGSRLLVFAYNDSVALYNGKPVVSATGGTWHRSNLMMKDLGTLFPLRKYLTDSVIIWESENKKLAFFLKPNNNRGIYHTQQVELNGFIHAALFGTSKENKGYDYFGKRSYTPFIPNGQE